MNTLGFTGPSQIVLSASVLHFSCLYCCNGHLLWIRPLLTLETDQQNFCFTFEDALCVSHVFFKFETYLVDIWAVSAFTDMLGGAIDS